MVVKAPVAPTSNVSAALWVQGFGDREDRNEFTSTNSPTLGGVPGVLLTPNPAGGPNQVLSLVTDLSRVTTTAGMLGGADFTIRDFTGRSDVLVLGALAGYQTTHVAYKSSTNTADVTGPSLGIYGAYVSGAFSVDGTLKVDLFTQDTAFSSFPGTPFATTGTTSVTLNNYSLANNFNYRFPISTGWYFEPTAGYLLTRSDFSAAAAALGFGDSNSTRLQGGARVGTDWTWGTVKVNSTLTGLAFDSVKITGGALNTNGFAGTTVPTDEGKVFGQFLLADNFDFGNGFSVQASGDVRFRTGIVGVGARGVLRYQW